MARSFRAAFDGGARGNPGIAAWGVAVLDDAGECVEGFAGYLGQATNNVAEYNGLIQALTIAADRNASQVEILSDSELVVRQINGQYKVRNEGLRPLYRKACRLRSRFALFRISHVRREENRHADELVNRMLDRVSAGEDPEPIHEIPGEEPF